MSRFDIVTGRESLEPSMAEAPKEIRGPQINLPNIHRDPDIRLVMPSGRQYVVPVGEADLVTNRNGDAILQIRLNNRGVADDISRDLQISTQISYRLPPSYIPGQSIRGMTLAERLETRRGSFDQSEIVWTHQAPQPGELTENQMRDILNEPV